MPEVGRDDEEYWLKLLMGLGVEARRLGEKLREEELLLDPDGSVRAAKRAVYRFECDCNERNILLIQSTLLSDRQRKLMKWRYIKKKPWADIVGVMNTDVRYTYRIHQRALRRLCRQNGGRDFKAEYRDEKARLDALNVYAREYE